MEHAFSEEYQQLTNATFQGYVNLGGFTYKNIDASRDVCELHLHRFTGMVMVKVRGGTYGVGNSCVQYVELATASDEVRTADPLPDEDELLKMAGESVQQQNAQTEAQNDEILAELGIGTPPNAGSDAPRRQKRSQRGE